MYLLIFEPMQETPEKMTVKQASEYSKLAATTLRDYIRDGKIQAVKWGRDWMIDTLSIDEYLKNRRPYNRKDLE